MKTMFTLMILLLFTVSLVAQPSERHIVVEELTGTWCQYCPRGAWYADSLMRKYENLIVIAIHINDPMEVPGYGDSSGLTGAPSANIDRTNKKIDTDLWFQKVNERSQENIDADVQVHTDYNVDTREISATVSANFLSDLSGDYRFAAVVIEDAVRGTDSRYDQSNVYAGSGYYTGGYESMPSKIPYSIIAYDHVARALLGGYNGLQNSIPATIKSNDQYSHTFTFTLPEEYDHNYSHVVGMVLKVGNDGNTSEIVNANKSYYLNGSSNAKPFFLNTPETSAYVGAEYVGIVYGHDTDDREVFIEPSGNGLPDWLEIEISGKKVKLSGTPTSVGDYPIELTIRDDSDESKIKFSITVKPGYSGTWNLVGGEPPFQKKIMSPDIAANKNGDLYTCYIDYATRKLYVLKYENNSWVQVGGSLVNNAFDAAIAVGKNGVPYVLYDILSNYDSKFLTVKKFNGTNWEQVGNMVTQNIVSGIDLILDKDDVPYVGSWVYEVGTKVWKFNPSEDTWNEVGDILAVTGIRMNLTFDNQNILHSLYVDYDDNKKPVVKKFENNEWSKVGDESPIDSKGTYFYCGLAIDQNDNTLYVAMTQDTTEQVFVYKWDEEEWSTIGENILNGLGKYTRIAVDDNGKIYVLNSDVDKNDKATVSTLNNGIWESVGPRGFNNGAIGSGELIIGKNNIPIACFRDSYLNEGLAVMSFGDYATGIEENIYVDHEFKVYPNPSGSYINIEIDNQQSKNYMLCDLLGKELFSGTLDSKTNRIDISQLPLGIYLLRIENKSYKIIKN